MKKLKKLHSINLFSSILIFGLKVLNGASGQNRTADTRIFSPLLYRLSYRGKNKWRFGRDLNPRSPVWQTSMLTTTPPNRFGCGRRIWTYDLRVMSPTSYQTAPSRDVWYQVGGERGIRTPAGLSSPTGFQDRTLQPLGYFSKIKEQLVDPTGLEPVTNRLWAGGSNQLSYGSDLVAPEGLEPTT